MKKNLAILLTFSSLSLTINAQLFKKLTDKVGDKANQAIDNKTNQPASQKQY